MKERKPKAKVVKEAKPAAKAKEASPRKVFGASIPAATAPAICRRSRLKAVGARPGRRRLFLSRACSSRSRSLRRRRRRRRPPRPRPRPRPPPSRGEAEAAKPKAAKKPTAKKAGRAREEGDAGSRPAAPAAAPPRRPPRRRPRAEEAPRFRVGDTVDVAPRTFPGINKAGRTGTITKVNDERSKDGGPMKDELGIRRTTGFTYAVKYTISGSEKRVDAQWIARIDEEEEDASDGGAAETLRTPGARGHGARRGAQGLGLCGTRWERERRGRRARAERV